MDANLVGFVALGALILGLLAWLRQDIRALRTEMNGLRTELRTEMNGLRTEMNDRIDGLRAEMTNCASGWRVSRACWKPCSCPRPDARTRTASARATGQVRGRLSPPRYAPGAISRLGQPPAAALRPF